MLDPAVHSKPDEQYPLLKIDGGGDMGHAQLAQTVVTTPVLGVTCKDNYRFSRWPECISACWMTLILCGISFLVFHALGMGFYSRQHLLIMKCNDLKPGSIVFYHDIIHKGSMIPFAQYTEYLAKMVTQYPLLHFNLIFLLDDASSEALRSSRRYVFGPYSPPWYHTHNLDDIMIGAEKYMEFKKRYQNLNVTIIPLSKYMSITPLKFKWRLIPKAHLSFYARVFSVWQNGGIGIDLKTFNNDYHSQKVSDPRIDAILRQHNDGVDTADYIKALNKIDDEEANAIFSMFNGIINNLLNETRAFFNSGFSLPSISNEKAPLIRTHRSKRHTSNASKIITGASNDLINYYNIENNDTKDKEQTSEISINGTSDFKQESANTTALTNSKQVNGSGSETNQVVWLYDFQIISSGSPSLPNNLFNKPPTPDSKTPSHLLSIDAEGTFIAATSKLHPFLAHLTTSGGFGLNPKFAIQNALLSQCSGALKDDVYCNNIYIL